MKGFSKKVPAYMHFDLFSYFDYSLAELRLELLRERELRESLEKQLVGEQKRLGKNSELVWSSIHFFLYASTCLASFLNL